MVWLRNAAQEGYIDKIGNEAGGYLKKTKIGSELKPFIEPPLKNETNLRLAEKLVLDYTNKERAKYGLKPLKWNEALARAARLHSEDMGVRITSATYLRKGKVQMIGFSGRL